MKSEVKKLDGGRIEVKVVLDKSEIADSHKTAVEELAKHVKIKGYRAGKAPLYAIERQLDPNALMQKTADVMVRNTLFPALTENKIAVSSQPEIEVTKFVPAETFEYKATADLMPEVKLADYKSLKAKRTKVEKTDEKEIDEFIKSMAARNRDWKDVKRAAKNGDRVVIDFLGKENGEPFEGGAGKEFALELGSNTFVPGFEEQLVGHPAGEEFVIDVTFPKDYHAHLANKKVQFEIKMHKVQEAGEAKVDDEFAKTMGFANLEEFKTEVRKNRERVAENENEDRFLDALVQELVKKSKIVMPQGIIDRMAHEIHHQSPNAPEELVHEQAKSRAEMLAVLNALADEMKLAVSDEELNAQIDALKIQNKNNPELVERLNSNAFIRDDIRARMRLDKVAAELRKFYSK
jgi:trigger factor